MEPSDLRLLRDLLTRERVLSLGVLAGAEPVVGVLPFLAEADLGSLVVHASRLARHSKGLADGAAFGAAIHAPDTGDVDPLRLPRLTLEGRVEAVPEGLETDRVTGAWSARFPSAALTLSLGDFSFWRLRIGSGRLVAGFGRAFNVASAQLGEAAALPEPGTGDGGGTGDGS
jgi:heme oxygenase (biliverdin-IX-beta and delta-forming)